MTWSWFNHGRKPWGPRGAFADGTAPAALHVRKLILSAGIVLSTLRKMPLFLRANPTATERSLRRASDPRVRSRLVSSTAAPCCSKWSRGAWARRLGSPDVSDQTTILRMERSRKKSAKPAILIRRQVRLRANFLVCASAFCPHMSSVWSSIYDSNVLRISRSADPCAGSTAALLA